MEKENLKTGFTYIIKGKNSGNSRTVYKITVIEITDKSIYLKFVDSGSFNRYMLEEFYYQYEVVEIIGNELQNKMIDVIKNLPISYCHCENQRLCTKLCKL